MRRAARVARRAAAWSALVAVAGLCWAGDASAQADPGASDTPRTRIDAPLLPRRQLEPAPLPLPGDATRPPPSLEAAPAPRTALAGVDLSMTLRDVEFIAEDEAAAALAMIEGVAETANEGRGRTVGFEEIEALRLSLTEIIVAAGYVSSSLRLAEIDLDRGVVRFEIIAGRLAAVRASGEGVVDDDLREPGDLGAGYVAARMAGDGGVFSLPETEEALRVLIRDRNVDRVVGAVRPGEAPGDAVLDLDVTAREPWNLAATVANDTPDGIGEETLTLAGAARNLLVSGDELRAEAAVSEGRRSLRLEADAPLWPGGPAPYIAFEHSSADFVTQPFKRLDVASRFTRVGVGIRAPLIETSTRRLTSIVGFDLKRTRSSLAGEPFSFSAGVQNGKTRLSVLTFAQEFIDLGEARTFAARAEVNIGLPILSATKRRAPGPGLPIDPTDPDASFVSFVGQAQVAQRLTPDVTLIARAQGQVSDGALLPIEQVAIGGRDTVRGFGESVLTGDEALVGSLEARISLMDLALPELSPPGYASPLVLAPFVDAGAVWARRGQDDALVGVGAGLLWAPRPGMDASLYFGVAATGRDLRGGGLQGEGVHLALSFAFP